MHQEQKQPRQQAQYKPPPEHIHKLKLLYSRVNDFLSTFTPNLGPEHTAENVAHVIDIFKDQHGHYFNSPDGVKHFIQTFTGEEIANANPEALIIITVNCLNWIEQHQYEIITDKDKEKHIKTLFKIFNAKYQADNDIILRDPEFLTVYNIREQIPSIIKLLKVILAGEDRDEMWQIIDKLSAPLPTDANTGNNSIYRTYTGESQYNPSSWNNCDLHLSNQQQNNPTVTEETLSTPNTARK